MSLSTDVGLPAMMRARFLEENLRALRVPPHSAKLFSAAEPAGDFLTLPDGSLALRRGGVVIGAPAEQRSRERSLDELSRGDAVVVFGLGVGHLARELMSRGHSPVVVFEPDAGLARKVLSSGPSDLEGVTLVGDVGDLPMIWASIVRSRTDATVLAAPGYPELFPEAYQELQAAVGRSVENNSVNLQTGIVRGREWLRHVLDNVEVLTKQRPVTALAGALRGVPAFVVGAGPSLGDNVQLLREASRKGVVIVVDVAARVLAQHGVVPHFLVTVEAQDLSRDISALPWDDDVILCASLSSAPAMVWGEGKLRLPYHEDLRIYESLTELVGAPPLSVGGSVSTVAFSLAERLGCSPIVMVGQDLAYSRGRTHAEGTLFDDARVEVDDSSGRVMHTKFSAEGLRIRASAAKELGELKASEELKLVPAWGGLGVAASTPVFQVYRSWFETAARVMASDCPDRRLVNATEGGSRIHGWEELTLREVLDGLEPLQIVAHQLFEDAGRRHALLPPEVLVDWAIRSARAMSRLIRLAKKIERVAPDAVEAIEQGRIGDTRAAFSELDALEADFAIASRAHSFLEAHAYRALVAIDILARGHPEGDAPEDAVWSLRHEALLAREQRLSAEALKQELLGLARRVRQAPGQARKTSLHTSERKEQCPS